MFSCPVCGGMLKREERSYRCPKGHSYDISAQGYVHLLLPNQKHSRDPGDNAEMVLARTHFLDSGSYAPLAQLLGRKIASALPQGGLVLDAGCGEGYYAQQLCQSLAQAGKSCRLCGIDLSRPAIRHAARRCPEGNFAIASLFSIPLANEAANAVYSVFTPLCPEEFARVLHPRGTLWVVCPGPRHLFELKEILYEVPYENPQEEHLLPGFRLSSRKRLNYSFTLNSQEEIQDLFKMTPYFYKSPMEGCHRLQEVDSLKVTADFWLLSYEKAPAPVKKPKHRKTTAQKR